MTKKDHKNEIGCIFSKKLVPKESRIEFHETIHKKEHKIDRNVDGMID